MLPIPMVRTTRRRLLASAWLACLLLLSARDEAEAQRATASALLARDHWAVAALRRIEASAPDSAGSDVSANTLSLSEMALRLRRAAERLNEDARWGPVARAYRDRFEEEFAGVPLAGDRGFVVTGASAGAGVERSTGRAAPGAGWFRAEDWTGAQALDDLESARAFVSLSAALGRHVALQLSAAPEGERHTLDGSHALVGISRLEVWAGRRNLHFGPASGGVVLGGPARFDAAGFHIREPFRLPWFLRALGPIRFETFLSRLERNGHVDNPWFWAARGSIQPFKHAVLGINRGAIFGGAGNPVRLVDVLEMIAGGYGGEGGEFENQVVSVDLRVTVPAALPFELYAEWGSDDGAGMWYRAPGITAGATLYALPLLPAVFAGIEGSFFGPKPECCNTYWYRNVFFRGAWSKDNVTLAHPLGGHGHEAALALGSDLSEARLRLRSRFALRSRGAENLYAPERAGGSRAAEAGAAVRFRHVEIGIGGAIEEGRSWQSQTFVAALRAFF